MLQSIARGRSIIVSNHRGDTLVLDKIQQYFVAKKLVCSKYNQRTHLILTYSPCWAETVERVTASRQNVAQQPADDTIFAVTAKTQRASRHFTVPYDAIRVSGPYLQKRA